MTDDVFDTTALVASGVAANGPAASAALHRRTALEMTQAAEDAVLAPTRPGAWSASIRAAFAVRIALLNENEELAERYRLRMEDEDAVPLSRPENDGAEQGLAEVVAFMDKVAANTRDVAVADIEGLKAAGIADDDIVRLAELNAFLAYQIRVVAGLNLMRATK